METLTVRKIREINSKLAKSRQQKSTQQERSYGSSLAEIAAEATKKLRKKNSEERARIELFESRLRKLKISACFFASIVLALFIVRSVSQLIPNRDFSLEAKECTLAEGLAGVVRESEAIYRDEITIITLSAEGNRHYKSIISRFKNASGRSAVGCINVYWAFSDAEYDPENGGDFSSCLSDALRKFPATGTLVVLSGGLIPFFEKGEELEKFLDGKGHLILVGELRDGRLVEKIGPEEKVSVLMRDLSGGNSENSYRVYRL